MPIARLQMFLGGALRICLDQGPGLARMTCVLSLCTPLLDVARLVNPHWGARTMAHRFGAKTLAHMKPSGF